jgi:type IV pilus assembly protein PilE
MRPRSIALHRRGFTLIELLVVLVIAGVLASIALPSFAEALRRARRAEGVAALLHLQLAQERWRTEHSRYAASLSDLALPSTSESRLYSLAITQSDEVGFVAVATAGSLQSTDAACRVLKLSQLGGSITKSSVDAAGVETLATGNRCWQ